MYCHGFMHKDLWLTRPILNFHENRLEIYPKLLGISALPINLAHSDNSEKALSQGRQSRYHILRPNDNKAKYKIWHTRQLNHTRPK